MRTLALLTLMSGLALAAKPVFEVPEAGGFDRAMVTLGVTNDTDKPLKIEKGFCEGLSVSDKDGKALKMASCDDVAGFTLGAGESVTRRFNLATCFPDIATVGTYSVGWTHPVFGDAPPGKRSIEIVDEYCEIEIDGWGSVFCRFFKDAPETVQNFKDLVKGTGKAPGQKPFYDGKTFHRILPRFMMQGGCPNGDGTGDPGYKIKDEVATAKTKHEPGVLSMAKESAPNTGGSQFFICFANCAHLDGIHTTFGKVMDGMDVIFRIEREAKLEVRKESDPRFGRPANPIVMKKVTWHEKAK